METPRDRDDQLAAELRALRPQPRPEFTAELDERAAAGFPRRSRLPRLSFERLGAITPRRILLPAGGLAVVAIAVTAAVLAISGTSERTSLLSGEAGSREETAAPAMRESAPKTLVPQSMPSEAAVEENGAGPDTSSSYGSSPKFDDSGPQLGGSAQLAGKPGVRPRAVERSAELVLGAAPADVGEDTSEVFEAVHAHDGIVMRSSSREGKAGVAGARFELLIPSDKLSDALAALSAIDEVLSRHEATADITAPTVSTAELLRDSKARIDSLLAQLEEAETESEREVVEAELRQERRHRARLRASLQNLQRRADLSRVLARIETGVEDSPSDEGAWGVTDAIDDAGKILAVAAAVTVVSLAILGPFALIALLAWLTYRAWIRRERRRVLS